MCIDNDYILSVYVCNNYVYCLFRGWKDIET